MYLKDNKFKRFFTLGFLFNRNPEGAILNHQANDFLNKKHYVGYAHMLQEGYKPNAQQTKEFEDHIKYCLCGYYETYNKELENILKTGYELNQKQVIKFFTTVNSKIFTEDELFKPASIWTKCPTLHQQIQTQMLEPSFSENLAKEFLVTLDNKNFNKNHVLESMTPILVNQPEMILNHIHFVQFLKINKKLQTTLSYSYQKDILNNLAKNYYTTLPKKQPTPTVVQSIIKKENIDLTKFPNFVSTVIQSIEELYDAIQKNSNTSQNIDFNQLNNLMEKRIPEVLNKFLKVEPNYRTTLTNTEGKNAEQLMLESLENIKMIFETTFKDIHQEHVNDLSATNRYTKSLKV
jgi:hypothetical protein